MKNAAKGSLKFEDILEIQKHTRIFTTNQRSGDPTAIIITRRNSNTLAHDIIADGSDVVSVQFDQHSNFNMSLDGTKPALPKFNYIETGSGTTILNNLSIKELRARSGDIRISDSRILLAEITLNSSLRTVIFENTKIGVLKISNGDTADIGSVQIYNGSVLQLIIAPTISIREIVFDGVYFETELETVDKRGSQIAAANRFVPVIDRPSFSYLKKWADSVGDTKIAHIARGTELAIEYSQSVGMEKFVLFMWKMFSNFGLSLSKPLAWLFALFIGVFILLLFTGTVTEISINPKEINGWQNILIGNEPAAQINRAMFGAAESVLPSFAIISGNQLITPCSSVTAILRAVVHALSFFLLIAAGFALRRRFKPS